MEFPVYTILLVLRGIVSARAGFDIGFQDDTDLTSFVTRPDIRAPLFDVKVYDAQSTEPGFWFVAPYANIIQEPYPQRYYQPCQTGPHIYDSDGTLVWTGACSFKNQNTCDFRVFEQNNSYFLSAILYGYGGHDRGRGIIMDNSYNVIKNLTAPAGLRFNMHELDIRSAENTALYLVHKPQYSEVTHLGDDYDGGWVSNNGVVEVDLATDATLFSWWTDGHVSTSESTVQVENLYGPPPSYWNWFHANSIDKNEDGDYLVSARFTDCIYKISGKDGHILWRLGGTDSSFVLDGFNFSRQHDARWMQYNEAVEVISFLDNAADDRNNTSTFSSALIVELDKRTTPMTARVLHRWIRPDEKLSRLRGNMQTLPGGNVFVGWSDNSYITEHSRDGRLLMEAQFQSKRFVTYRAYKFNFTGAPTEPPVLKAYGYGLSDDSSVTVYYVSWNGATEVAVWRFYREDGASPRGSTLIGTRERTGFETVFQSRGLEAVVYAEAVGRDGSVLGRSLRCPVVTNIWGGESENLNSEVRPPKDEL